MRLPLCIVCYKERDFLKNIYLKKNKKEYRRGSGGFVVREKNELMEATGGVRSAEAVDWRVSVVSFTWGH